MLCITVSIFCIRVYPFVRVEYGKVYGNIAFTVNEFKCIQRARLTLDMATLKYATVPRGKILPLAGRDSHSVKIT